MSTGGHMRPIETLPKSWQSVWNKWELQGWVIASLASQILLSLIGYRRKYRVDILTRSLVWTSYLVADWVATFGLGVIISKVGGSYDHKNEAGNVLNPQLIAFWAPFFLMHCGGPWTITAYSLEDNELWPRQLIALVSQTVLTLYIIILSWKSSSWLSWLSLPMLVVGFIKYGEKTWTLYKASIKHRRDSLLSSWDSIMDFPENLEPGKLFRSFMGLFISLFTDVVLSTSKLSEGKEKFEKLGPEGAFKRVERELGVAFDVFYTRASLRYTVWGIISLNFTFYATIGVSVLYIVISKLHFGLDGKLTYMLLSVAVMMEFHEFMLLYNSEWPSRLMEYRCRLFSEGVLPWLVTLLGFTRSESLPQYNLLTFCLENRGIACRVTLIRKSLGLLNITRCHVTSSLKEFIFTSFRTKSEAIINGRMPNTGEIGNAFDDFESFEWTKRFEFHQSILTWHIATNLCYYSDDNDGSAHSEASKKLSDYMFYLLVKCRHMLPVGTGLLRCRDTCDETVGLLPEGDQESTAYVTEAWQRLCQHNTVGSAHSMSVLFDAVKLAICLLDRSVILQREQMWELLAKMWIEILGYAAIHCRVDNHAQQLRRGGEFLSHVWLLQAHLGLLPQFHVTNGKVGELINAQPLENAV